METFAILIGVGIIILGVVLGILANRCDPGFSDEQIQNYVFRNAFRNQIHDYFNHKK